MRKKYNDITMQPSSNGKVDYFISYVEFSRFMALFDKKMLLLEKKISFVEDRIKQNQKISWLIVSLLIGIAIKSLFQ